MRGGKGGNRWEGRKRLRRAIKTQGKGYGDVKARQASVDAEARRQAKLAVKNEQRERAEQRS